MTSVFDKFSKRTTGLTLTVFGVLALTPDSLLVRKVANVPVYTILFYRNLLFALFMLVGLAISEKWNTWNKIRALGRWGTFTGLVFGFSITAMLVALANTSAANVLVIQASNPVFAAIFSWYLLKEKATKLTIGTSLVCIAAIILIFAGEVAEGNDSEQVGNNSFGLLCAIGSSVSFGLYIVMLRWLSLGKGVEIDMMPCNIVAGFFAAFIAACTGPDLAALTGVDFVYIMLQGFGVLGVGFMLITWAPSYIPAPEVSLYTLIETVLGPVWVYIGGYEAPSVYAICGGLILLVALAVHGYVSLKEETEAFTELPDEENNTTSNKTTAYNTPVDSDHIHSGSTHNPLSGNTTKFSPVKGSCVANDDDGVEVFNVMVTGAAESDFSV
mmetsp:Transcript_37248/g.64365  ORF Transcript_37248/g.64365 Transcript_37248/m.64365 type:complete len:385 (-) Transcript_37248:84-1238(-)